MADEQTDESRPPETIRAEVEGVVAKGDDRPRILRLYYPDDDVALPRKGRRVVELPVSAILKNPES